MTTTTLVPAEANKQKAELARNPSLKPHSLTPTADIANLFHAAGNMAIQRAAAGPSAHNPAATSILGGASMDSGECSCGGTCDECKQKQLMQRKGEGDLAAIPSGFDAAVQRSGSGAPLHSATRSMMEGRFGDRFEDVRVHDDMAASDAARHIQAQAFTSGHDIYFAPGRYQPTSLSGQKLLAHELTHVLQQRRGAVPPGKPLNESPSNNVFEQEAAEAGYRIAAELSLATQTPDISDYLRQSEGRGPASSPVQKRVDSPSVVQCEHEQDLEMIGKSADLSELWPNAHKLRNGALKLFTIGNKLKKQGTHFYGDDKAKLASAYNILDLAKALTDLAQGVEGISGGASGGLKIAGKTATHLRNLTAAVKLAADLFDDEKAQAFEADPMNFDKAAAWATQAADTFGAASKLIDVIPDGLLPGFVKEIWKGLLRAPASYVKAFLSIMTSHIAQIDAASGGAKSKERVTQGYGGDWEGPLSMVYFRAPLDLREFMQSHRKRSGLDLFEVPEGVGKGQLLAMIEAEADPAMKARWIALVEGEPERK